MGCDDGVAAHLCLTFSFSHLHGLFLISQTAGGYFDGPTVLTGIAETQLI